MNNKQQLGMRSSRFIFGDTFIVGDGVRHVGVGDGVGDAEVGCVGVGVGPLGSGWQRPLVSYPETLLSSLCLPHSPQQAPPGHKKPEQKERR